MADFDLTQTDQQVQNILNDAQGAMGASAQTTLTTEYVMLKDTSGIYHKILKSSFTEAIRDVLAGLLVNNDKGTTISQIAAIASGDFGSITPANLASVLGVWSIYSGSFFLRGADDSWYIQDLNTIVDGLHMCSPSQPNAPANNLTGLTMQLSRNSYKFQLYFAITGAIYYRIYVNAWQTWKSVSLT